MELNIKQKIKENVMAGINLSGEINDEDVMTVIDKCILAEFKDSYVPLKERINLRNEIFNSIRKMDILSEFLEDDEITEIMINGPDNIFYEKAGRLYKSDKSFESTERLMTVIQQIVGEANRMVNESNPIVDSILKDGSRVNIVLKGVSVDGSAVTIRKFPKETMNMEKLIALESLDEKVAEFLGMLVASGYNIFISGDNVIIGLSPSDFRKRGSHGGLVHICLRRQ